MKLAAATFLLGLVSASGFNFDDAKGTPIDKVIVLITGLAKDIEKDGADEQASYDKYSCWVEDTMQRKATDISKAKELIGELNDSVKKLKAEIASHGAEIKQLQKDIAQNNEATKDATALRKKENAEYASDRAESEQCTGALEAAVKVLTGAGTKKSGFLQEAQLMSVAGGVRKVVSHAAARAKMSDTDLQLISRFVQDPQAFTARGLVAAQTGQNPFGDYAPQSSQIQGILKGMYDAFASDIEKDNADEANKQKSFEELMAVKTQELKTLEASLQTQETDSAAKTKQLSEDSVLRDDTIEQLAADEKFFEETKTAAEAKAHKRNQEESGIMKDGASSAYAKMSKPITSTSVQRFQMMAERETRSDLPKNLAENILDAQEFTKWRGVSLYKCCYDFLYYPLLLQELKPRTIIETGSFCGAGASFLNDMATNNLGQNWGKVISNDITLEHVPQALRDNPNLEFVEAGNAKLVDTLGLERCRQLPRPLLFIEDAHFEFSAILEAMHNVLQPGDYIIVEDTNAVVHQVWQDPEWLDKHNRPEQMEENQMCERKRETLREFCIKHADQYRVDSHYQDMFGYNVGKVMNSIVKRVA